MAHDKFAELRALGTNQHKPEAVSVFVAIPAGINATDGLVRDVAVQLAALTHEGRNFGQVLHVEPVDGGFEVAVEATGTRFSAANVGVPMAAVR